jgi:hypothetical protein
MYLFQKADIDIIGIQYEFYSLRDLLRDLLREHMSMH